MKGSCSSSLPSEHEFLIIGTSNESKFFEIRSALGSISVPVRGLKDFPSIEHPPETGKSFEANAKQKAEFYFDYFKRPILAEDSGLVIPALEGYPGIHSARIAADDASRIQLVLEKLRKHQEERLWQEPGSILRRKLEPDIGGKTLRQAYYVCSMVLKTATGTYSVQGRCDGEITEGALGNNGFGYDPIFRPHESKKTFAEMTIKEKTAFSHRGRAVELIVPYILQEFHVPFSQKERNLVEIPDPRGEDHETSK